MSHQSELAEMPTQYSPIGPIALLQDLQGDGIYPDYLGHYLLVLAHDVLAHPKAYADLAETMRDRSLDTFIILDNGSVELDEPICVEGLHEAAIILSADCVVLPDIMQNFEATRDLIEGQLESIFRMKEEFPLMKVPQGSSTSELVACAQWLHKKFPVQEEIDFWAVPRWVTNVFGSRLALINYINNTIENPLIHLLGMSKNSMDDIACCAMLNVMGIDSANPVVFGQRGLLLAADNYAHLDRGDYWSDTHANSMARSNILYMRERINLICR